MLDFHKILMSSRVFLEPDVLLVDQQSSKRPQTFPMERDERFLVLQGLLSFRSSNQALASFMIPPFGDAVLLDILRATVKSVYPQAVDFCERLCNEKRSPSDSCMSENSLLGGVLPDKLTTISTVDVMVNLRLWPAQFTGSTPFFASFHPKSIESSQNERSTWLRFVCDCFQKCGGGVSGDGVLFTSMGVRIDNPTTFSKEYMKAKSRHEARKELLRLRGVEFEALDVFSRAHYNERMDQGKNGSVEGSSNNKRQKAEVGMFEKRSKVLPKHIPGVDNHGFAFDILCVEKSIVANSGESLFLDVTLPELKRVLVNVFHVPKGPQGLEVEPAKSFGDEFDKESVVLQRQQLLLPLSKRRIFETSLQTQLGLEATEVAVVQAKRYNSDRVAFQRRLFDEAGTSFHNLPPNEGLRKSLSLLETCDRLCPAGELNDVKPGVSPSLQSRAEEYRWSIERLDAKQREKMRNALRRQTRRVAPSKVALSEINVPRRLLSEEVSNGVPATRYCIPKIIADRARVMVSDPKVSPAHKDSRHDFVTFFEQCSKVKERRVEKIDELEIVFITPHDLETLPSVMSAEEILGGAESSSPRSLLENEPQCPEVYQESPVPTPFAVRLSESFLTQPTERDMSLVDEFLSRNKKLALEIANSVGTFGFPSFINPYSSSTKSQIAAKEHLSLQGAFPHVLFRSNQPVGSSSSGTGLRPLVNDIVSRLYSYEDPRVLLQLVRTHRISDVATMNSSKAHSIEAILESRPTERKFEFLSKMSGPFPYESPIEIPTSFPQLSRATSRDFSIVPLRPGEFNEDCEVASNESNGRSIRITHTLPHALQQLLALQLAADHTALRTLLIMDQSLSLSPKDSPLYCGFVLHEMRCEMLKEEEVSPPGCPELELFRERLRSVSKMPFADFIASPHFDVFASFEEEAMTQNVVRRTALNNKLAVQKPSALLHRIRQAQETFDVVGVSAKEMFATFLIQNPNRPMPAVEKLRYVLGIIESRASGSPQTRQPPNSAASWARDGQGGYVVSHNLHKSYLPFDLEFHAKRTVMGHLLWTNEEVESGFQEEAEQSALSNLIAQKGLPVSIPALLSILEVNGNFKVGKGSNQTRVLEAEIAGFGGLYAFSRPSHTAKCTGKMSNFVAREQHVSDGSNSFFDRVDILGKSVVGEASLVSPIALEDVSKNLTREIFMRRVVTAPGFLASNALLAPSQGKRQHILAEIPNIPATFAESMLGRYERSHQHENESVVLGSVSSASFRDGEALSEKRSVSDDDDDGFDGCGGYGENGETVSSNAIPRLYKALFEHSDRRRQARSLFGYTHKNPKSMTASKKLVNLQTAPHEFGLKHSNFNTQDRNSKDVLDFSVVSARAFRGVQMLRTRQEIVDTRYLGHVLEECEQEDVTENGFVRCDFGVRSNYQPANPTYSSPQRGVVSLPMGLVTSRLGERLQLDGGSLRVGDVAVSTITSELYVIEGFKKVAKGTKEGCFLSEEAFLQSNPYHATSPFVMVAHCRRVLRATDNVLDHCVQVTTDTTQHGVEYPNCSHFLRYGNIWDRAIAFAGEQADDPSQVPLPTVSGEVTVIDFSDAKALRGTSQSLADRVEMLFITYTSLHRQQNGATATIPSRKRVESLLELEALFIVPIDEVFGTEKKGGGREGGLKRFERFAALDGRTMTKQEDVQQLINTLKGFLKRLFQLIERKKPDIANTYSVPGLLKSRALLGLSDYRTGQEVLACFAVQFLRPFFHVHISQNSAPVVRVAPSTSFLTDECCDVVAFGLKPTSSTQSLLSLKYSTCRALRRLSTYYKPTGSDDLQTTSWGPLNWLENIGGVAASHKITKSRTPPLVSLHDDKWQQTVDGAIGADLVSTFLEMDVPAEMRAKEVVCFVENRRRLCILPKYDCWAESELVRPLTRKVDDRIVGPISGNGVEKSQWCDSCTCSLKRVLPE